MTKSINSFKHTCFLSFCVSFSHFLNLNIQLVALLRIKQVFVDDVVYFSYIYIFGGVFCFLTLLSKWHFFTYYWYIFVWIFHFRPKQRNKIWVVFFFKSWKQNLASFMSKIPTTIKRRTFLYLRSDVDTFLFCTSGQRRTDYRIHVRLFRPVI